LQNGKNLTDLARWLALFEVDYEAKPCTRSQGEIGLRRAYLFARGANDPSNRFRR
jgi:hypothetical protein